MTNPNDNARLVVYGHHRCGLALRLEEALKNGDVDYEWRDVQEGEPRFRDELRQLARGHLSVPTVIFPDGTVMVEPRPDDVLRRLKWGSWAGMMWLLGLA
jgi:mycoredoxin